MKKKKCDYCDKMIEGFTMSQVDYLMMQHILSKHREKLEVKKDG